MNRYLYLLLLSGLAFSHSRGDLLLGTGNLLEDELPTISSASAGWLVQMYRDVDGDTDLSSLAFDENGIPQGINASDDVLLASYVSALTYQNPPFGELVTFNETFDTFSDIYGASVYTVILNTNSWNSATIGLNSTFVLDQTPYTISMSGEDTYTAPSDNPGNHEWTTVIPEPGTLILIALGFVAILLSRTKWQHC